MMSQHHDSIKKRYIFKLLASLFSMGVSFGVQMMVPRGLGPVAYGNYSFLTSFFNQIFGFFDMGTSICFYNKLSQRPQDSGLVIFYLSFASLICVTIVLVSVIAVNTENAEYFWPGQQPSHLYLAVIFAALIWMSQIFSKMTDAFALTTKAELLGIFQKSAGCIAIAAFFFTYALDLANYFLIQITVYLILLVGLSVIIKKYHQSIRFRANSIGSKATKKYITEFTAYSHPLVVYSLVGMISGILDRWLLQQFGGSLEQGYFGLSYQIGALCFVFTGAASPLLMREFSIAFADNKIDAMKVLFRKFIPIFYFLTSIFACFVFFHSDYVVILFAGDGYKDAALPVAIMALYPIHQTYGQLSGDVFYATGQTSLYRNIGVFAMILSIPATYFAVAPPEYVGLGAGAEGLAFKMVMVQFVAVNIQLFYNTKLLKLNYWKFVQHQCACLMVLLSLSYLARLFTILCWGGVSPILILISSGIIYCLLALVAVWVVPSLLGLKRTELNYLINKTWAKIISITGGVNI